jgi:decaprenyl-phosphate phosphoribosyltransferase
MTSIYQASQSRQPRPAPRRSGGGQIRPYVALARPDHWVKNAFMVLGVWLALFHQPELLRPHLVGAILWAVATTCLLASSNYVLNEILDARSDHNHPVKRQRPVPSGQVRVGLAYAEWVILAALGLTMAAVVNRPFVYSGLFLLVMGVLYNVPPIRLKELPYVDVLSESINNPIRLMLGWFAVNPSEFPPVSLLISYWMIGAFLMASKRLAEYRSLASSTIAASYRRSFRYYNEQRILVSMFFYTTCFSLFLGIFIVRYHLELVLLIPMVAGFVCYYLHVALKPDSAAQAPERLFREKGLVAYLLVCALTFVALMLAHIPQLYEWFNVTPSPIAPLWRL